MINQGLGADYYRWDLGDSNVTNERHPIEYFHEVFNTNSIHIEWDGSYRGREQSMDTYAYILRVKRYDGEEKAKEGFIELIR